MFKRFIKKNKIKKLKRFRTLNKINESKRFNPINKINHVKRDSYNIIKLMMIKDSLS